MEIENDRKDSYWDEPIPEVGVSSSSIIQINIYETDA
jgi:hypothetical protein